MSGSATLPTTPLSNMERVDVRRFCGYPAYGAGSAGFQSWRFFDAYGTLEYRLSNLADEELQVVRQYLTNLYALEFAVPAAGANLDTDQASVWKHNPQEVVDRTKLFDDWCRRLAFFLGVPVGPGLCADTSIII